MRRVRGKRIAMILQDPMASLNPLFTIGDQVAEPLRVHEGAGRRARVEPRHRLLKSVRIPAPEARVREYPHQMSGGMRQRIVGAIAISCAPRLLIADEPTTSLDVTIQAQYLNLLRDLQREHRLALIFITHNLGIVAKMCDQVAVMYAGRLVEWGPVTRIFDAPGPSLHARAARVDPAHGRRPRAAHRHRGPAARTWPRRPAAAPSTRAARRRWRAAARRRRPRPSLGPSHTARCWLNVGRAVAAPTGAMTDRTPLLEARNLTKHFPVRRGLPRQAARGGARGRRRELLDRRRARRSALVGESGCGKTTTAKLVLRLEKPTGGALRFDGQDISGLDAARASRSTGSAVQAVFQDPFASLNPRMRVDAIIAEPLVTHERLDRREVDKRGRASCSTWSGLPGALGRALPARVLGRPAAAHRDRAVARALARAGRARRAGLRARRVDPGPDPEPAARPAGTSSGCPTSSSPTTWPRWRT